ncbi:DUF4253 domain-containing protein [Siphonobacter sp. SORGH_AS_1065]|uniref:DUF4253 domain-containing protein n=1 Tax=Siphonobacter sp. SORGH_AS_1065 TaxID=3041795 RepID=UPI00278932FD|nr:DUF4253 domain-containing protein [Siphonobacter sp. SORGH_AS_1065]MDQ1088644.1 hypothetical protein [Siphonobacter sp. SORGH_AS_1065]
MSKIYLFAILVLLISCKNNSSISSTEHNFSTPELSFQTGIEISLINLLEKETKGKGEHLKTYFSQTDLITDSLVAPQSFPDQKTVLLPGICYPISSKEAGIKIIKKLRPYIESKNYRLFLVDGSDSTAKLAVVHSEDEWTPLVYMQTRGANYGLNTPKLITHLKDLNETLHLKLIGADYDWCEFEIEKEPDNWQKVAEKVYRLCPDIVDQGAGNVESLTKELEQTKRLYLWFD